MTDADLRRRLGAAARRTVEREYDVDQAARRLEAVFTVGARATAGVTA
jgi:hypothetical protein